MSRIQSYLWADVQIKLEAGAALPVAPPAPKPPSVQTQYLREIYDPARALATLDWICAQLQQHRADFDVVAFRGSSGAPALAAAILEGIPVLHVRKDRGHCSLVVEGLWAGPRVAIVDDFIETGATVEKIMTILAADAKERGFPKPKLTKVFLYTNNNSAHDNIQDTYNCQVIKRTAL